MKIEQAAKLITAKAAKIGGEISFDEDGADIYWNNVRIQPAHKDVGRVLDAIELLVEMGAVSQ